MPFWLTNTSSAGNFDIGTFLKNLKTVSEGWGNYLLMALGVILIVWSAARIFKYFMAPDKFRGSMVITIVGLLFGGVLLFGGYKLMSGMAHGGKKTIEDLGHGNGGMIIPMLKSYIPW